MALSNFGLYSLVVLTIAVMARADDPISCYQLDWTNSSALPDDAAQVQCPPESTGCAKRYKRDMLLDDQGNIISIEVSWSWACMVIDPEGTAFGEKCGFTSEVSFGGDVEQGNQVTYERECSWCGNLSNSKETDDLCNDEPKFSKRCYGTSLVPRMDDPVLPADAQPIPCTATQFCAKQSDQPWDGPAQYSWKCYDLPGDMKCGTPMFFNNTQSKLTRKTCTCCNELCNGAQWDGIIASNPYCDDATTTSATTNEPDTTTAGHTEPPVDHSFETMTYVFASMWAFTFVLLLVACYFLYRLRHQLLHPGDAERAGFIKQEH